MVIFLIACATAIIVSFVCSMLEATLLSLDDVHLEGKKREGHRYAEVWQNMRKRIDRPIAAILILNTIAHTGGATVAGSSFDKTFGDEWIWLFSVVFTIVILLGTEILPKVIGVSHAERLAPIAAPLLTFMTTALSPVIAFTEWLSRPFKRAGGKRRMSIADLQTMAEMAKHEQVIGFEEGNIIINATKLRQMTVSSVMVPAGRIMLFDARQTNIVNFETAASSLHTRYPVTDDGTPAGIVGYVNFKEIVAMMPSRKDAQIQPFIRPLSRLAETTSLNDALKSLLGHREHMALVEDETHRIVGLITLEDLLEEIVGDLSDEFDRITDEIIEVRDRRWKIGGGARLADVARTVGVTLPAAESHFTLCDWLQQRQGREPRVGDITQEGPATFTVIQTRRRKANRVLVETA